MRFRLKDIQNISLKWKLLIPFLTLPVVLTVLLVAWGVRSQSQILRDQEEKRLRHMYWDFRHTVDRRLETSMSLAELVAANPAVQKALAERDRAELTRLYLPILKRLAGVKQFHFHLHPARSFLRLHTPDRHGDELSRRRTITRAQGTGKVTGGLEVGLTGIGLRGVAPVIYSGRTVGSVGIGASIEQPFLDQLKKDLGCDFTIYVPASQTPIGFRRLAATDPGRSFIAAPIYSQVMDEGQALFLTRQRNGEDLALLIGPIRDFNNQQVAVVELTRDRAATLSLIRKHTVWILSLGLAALSLSLAFVWLVSTLFLAPISALVDQAGKIAAGERVPQMEIMARDEFGALAEALNKMLASLEDSRYRLENYAHELEARFQERTAALVESEEKFRTLVENIPLVVYRLEHGLIRSFVGGHIERLTGWPAEEMVGGPAVWSTPIHPEDRDKVMAEERRCFEKGDFFEMEYRLRDRQGRVVEVLDHAEPVLDESGRMLYMEGYILDIREHKRLEEQTLQAEELKTLSEISARLAHEFRNPLSVVGLCAQRLSKTMSAADPDSSYSRILSEQVGRLEQILKMIQTYIQPMVLELKETDANQFALDLTRKTSPFLDEHEVKLNLDLKPDLPRVKIDPEVMSRALVNLILNAAYQIPPKGFLDMSMAPEGNTLEIKLVYPAGYLPDDQLRHFFYPFTTEDADTSLLDLPLVPVIVHRHNGIINVGREGEDLVAVTINLPLG